MAYPFYVIQRMARCGELSWICCIPRERIPDLLAFFKGLSAADALFAYDVACQSCPAPGTASPSPGGAPSGPVSPPSNNVPACAEKILAYVCSDTGKTVIGGLGDLLAVIAGLETGFPEVTALLEGVKYVIEHLVDICDKKETVTNVLHVMCVVRNAWNQKKESLPSPVKLALSLVTSAFSDVSALGLLLDHCCAEPAIMNTDLPDWAKQLLGQG